MRDQRAGSVTPTVEWDARLSTPGSPVCAPDWLGLREPADAAARSTELVDAVRDRLPAAPVVRDLGCGSGSMGRWLAPLLPGPQTWVLHDRDPELLVIAAAGLPHAAADGAPVTTRTVLADVTELRADDLAGTALVTASALLDLLTAGELDALVDACVTAGCAALLTLSVTGSVRFTPDEPRDAAFAAAFDAHQRRTDAGRVLLGPDAAALAVAAFERRGATVLTRQSPWRLGADTAELTEEWLRGWIAAACAQRPELAGSAPDYLRRRLDALSDGRLRVAVGHLDVLALPGGAR